MKFYSVAERKHVEVPDDEVRYYTKVIKNGTRKVTFARHGNLTKIVKNEPNLGMRSPRRARSYSSPRRRRYRSRSPRRRRYF